MATIDLRSDTVTRPTAAMRKAMAEAEVGDDVYGDDPTVQKLQDRIAELFGVEAALFVPSGTMANQIALRAAMAEAEVGDDVYGDDPTVQKLQDRIAELFGVEAALFVPSGTMANQIALRAHTQPGDEVIIGKEAHCWRHESGALAALAGLQTHMTADYTFTADDVRAAYKGGDDPHLALTRVVAVENTHNMSGGVCWDRARLAEVIDAAHGLGLAVHLDGARIWNAAIACGVPERELVRGIDSISACLSKGLGAPIGSVIAGRREFIRRCTKLRKMYGGGMRQAGILAAAGLHALDRHRARLADDHANARALAERLAGAKHLRVDPARVQTNIVMVELDRGAPAAVIQRAREAGVLLGSPGARRIRAVTHLDVDRAAVLRAAEVIADIAASL